MCSACCNTSAFSSSLQAASWCPFSASLRSRLATCCISSASSPRRNSWPRPTRLRASSAASFARCSRCRAASREASAMVASSRSLHSSARRAFSATSASDKRWRKSSSLGKASSPALAHRSSLRVPEVAAPPLALLRSPRPRPLCRRDCGGGAPTGSGAAPAGARRRGRGRPSSRSRWPPASGSLPAAVGLIEFSCVGGVCP
mmetsp:Transcript_1128/g.3125  ORF Transcript_1128/g.3125 Transcript_1128/m.3125 type:complete len:202 (+) Transcript_1128:217-822(+)